MFPPEVLHPERPQGDGGATYVNIPVSPTSKKQLNYMELQEPGSRTTSSHASSQSKSCAPPMLGWPRCAGAHLPRRVGRRGEGADLLTVVSNQ